MANGARPAWLPPVRRRLAVRSRGERYASYTSTSARLSTRSPSVVLQPKREIQVRIGDGKLCGKGWDCPAQMVVVSSSSKVNSQLVTSGFPQGSSY